MPEKILVVDDEPEALKLFGYALHRQGYEIIVAQNGQEGLALIKSQKPDLVVLDIMMPGMDGYEVCRRIRSDPETRALPVIMLTAKTETSDKLSGFEAGADDYVSKPVALPELFARVKALLARASYRSTSAAAAVNTKTIGFLGIKGGVGATTVAVNIALALVQRQHSVLLAELRLGGGTAAQMLGLPAQENLTTLHKLDVKEITPGAVRALLVTHATGLSLLTAPPTASVKGYDECQQLEPGKVGAILAGLKGLTQYLLLDLGCSLTSGVVEALSQCSRTVLIAEHCPLALGMIKAQYRDVASLGLVGNRIDIVVNNRSRTANSLSKTEMEKLVGQPLLTVIPPAPELAFQANREGSPIMLMGVEHVAVQSLMELAQVLT